MLTLFGKAETTRDNTLFSMGDLSFVAVVLVISMKQQIIEMHNKSVFAILSIFLCVGAAFLWNIFLAGVYSRTTPYKVRAGFFFGFGQNATWWITLIFIVICVYLFESGVLAIRKALFPTDTDVFQELEDNKFHKVRFQEAANPESGKRWSQHGAEPMDGSIEGNMELENLTRPR